MGIRERARTWSVLVEEGPRAGMPITIKCPLCRAVVTHRVCYLLNSPLVEKMTNFSV